MKIKSVKLERKKKHKSNVKQFAIFGKPKNSC